jgi:two-component system nitrogen regulation response regulator NtrX
MFPTILIVDDEQAILQSLGGILGDEGYEVLSASNGYEALKVLSAHSPDLVLLDIWMPGMDGIETLKAIRKDQPAIPVVMITGHGTIETAVKAIKHGAYDFIEKPPSIEKVVVTIGNALNFRRLAEENRYLRKKNLEKHHITGQSGPVLDLSRQIQIAAPTEAWILITGENGSGKELVAHTIHTLSHRSEHPMAAINCAGFSGEWIERELFGHEKGAFEGALQRRRGRFEMAHKGTLFLDEVGDLPLKTQARLLRVLEERKFQRVGGGRDIDMDARIIAATSKNLEEEVRKGAFREDLYYRLNVVPVYMPPVRERKEDIGPLLTEFLGEYARDNPKGPRSVSPEALALLTAYHWPGNVREIKNFAERMALMVGEPVILARHLPPPYGEAARAVTDPSGLLALEPWSAALMAFERAYREANLPRFGNDMARMAAALGVPVEMARRAEKK